MPFAPEIPIRPLEPGKMQIMRTTILHPPPAHYTTEYEDDRFQRLASTFWNSVTVWKVFTSAALVLFAFFFLVAVRQANIAKSREEKIKQNQAIVDSADRVIKQGIEQDVLLQELQSIRQAIRTGKSPPAFDPKKYHGPAGMDPGPLPSRPDPGDNLEYKTEPKIDKPISFPQHLDFPLETNSETSHVYASLRS